MFYTERKGENGCVFHKALRCNSQVYLQLRSITLSGLKKSLGNVTSGAFFKSSVSPSVRELEVLIKVRIFSQAHQDK